MIRLRVDDDSLKNTRLTYSPLWETVGSLGILARYRGEAPSPYTRWSRAVRSWIAAELERELVEPLRRPGLTSFRSGFIPVPDPARTTFRAELDHLRQTRGGTARADRLIGALARYWERAIDPYWTSIRSSLEEEILFRGRTLAVEGPEAMLGELGGRLLWSPPCLIAPYHEHLERTVTGARLLLVPTMFAGGLRLFMEEDGTVAMAYQARATGYFHALTAHARDQAAENRLALLLGKGRAQIIQCLEAPKTTTAVAESLGLAKSTVSQHLAVLTNAGLVWKQRLGGRVLYQLDQSGMTLLKQLGL